MGYQKPKVKIS